MYVDTHIFYEFSILMHTYIHTVCAFGHLTRYRVLGNVEQIFPQHENVH